MYKLLLSWRYLRTRYLALASIISVMLGVATLIVVNSVMGGFATKLRDRMRGIQSHVVVEYRSLDGMYDYERQMAAIRRLAGDKIEAMSPVIESFAMLQYNFHGETITRPIRLIGVDPAGKALTGDFAKHLRSQANKDDPGACFDLKGEALLRHDALIESRPRWDPPPMKTLGQNNPDAPPPPEAPEIGAEDPRIMGVVLGHGIATIRNPEAKSTDPDKDIHILQPGDEVTLLTMGRSHLDGHDGTQGIPRPAIGTFVVTDTWKCEMSEFDSNLVFVHIKDLQRLRTMQNRATSIQIKLKDYDRDKAEVVAALQTHFHPALFLVQTWEEKQGALLAAIGIEQSTLNLLLFLIIAVAGFGILAIFFMIVVEKMRDIGILKALGASNAGVMGIFLSYGLGLGLVGAGLGTALGMTITIYINEIEHVISQFSGHDVFPRDVYYFDGIPTALEFGGIFVVNLGAILIAVGASVFPSLRAALLHPVRALRYE
jgi:lipoprotein-releasing system permease protein